MYPEIYELIAKRGNLTFIKKLLQIKYVPNKNYNVSKIIHGAVESNNLHITDWLIENGYEYDPVATRGPCLRSSRLEKIVVYDYNFSLLRRSPPARMINKLHIMWLGEIILNC